MGDRIQGGQPSPTLQQLSGLDTSTEAETSEFALSVTSTEVISEFLDSSEVEVVAYTDTTLHPKEYKHVSEFDIRSNSAQVEYEYNTISSSAASSPEGAWPELTASGSNDVVHYGSTPQSVTQTELVGDASD